MSSTSEHPYLHLSHNRFPESHLIRCLVVGEATLLAGLGAGIGQGMAFWLTSLMSTLLFRVSTTDTETFAVVAALLCIVTLAACYIPAPRATEVDPMIALRYE